MLHRLWISLLGLALLLVGTAPGSTLTAAAAGSDWTAYQADVAGSGFNAGETTITTANAANLRVNWITHGGGPGNSAQPLAVGNVAYWGAWDGIQHATTISGPSAGHDVWTRNLGQTHVAGCGPGTVALAGTPAFGSIGGTPTVYVADGGNNAAGGGNVVLSALNATTGATEWQTALSPVAPDVFAWSSPVLSGGSVYYSLSSLADCPVIPGRVIKVNATSGAIEGSTPIGAGVWGTPTIDEATGMMYVPVGAPSHSGGFSDALVEVNTATMTVVAHWTVPASQTLSDGDFGSVPTLFTAGGRQLVGLGNKNGIFYAWDRTNIAAGPVWERPVAVGGNGPQSGQGTLSPAVWDGSHLYVAGGRTTISGAACAGGIRSLDPATGAPRWEFCAPGHILGPLAGAPGILAAGAGSAIVVLNAATGAELFRYAEPGGGLFWGGPSIGDGNIFAVNMDASTTALTVSGTTAGPGIALAPPSQSAVVGSTQTVTATVTGASGAPLSGVTVAFSVTSGPNAGQTGSGVTGSSGQATFSVTSATVGDDAIQASFTDSAGATHTSSPVQVFFTAQTLISNLSVKDTAHAARWSIRQNVRVGSMIYGDSRRRFTRLPAGLAGSSWIQTANASRTFTGNPLVTFSLGQQADVFVGMDRRAGRPAWLDATWSDTGMTEAGAGATYEVFRKTFPAGTVALGPNGSARANDYTIIVH